MPVIALATLIAVSLQLNGMLIMWKIQQGKKDDAIRAALLQRRSEELNPLSSR